MTTSRSGTTARNAIAGGIFVAAILVTALIAAAASRSAPSAPQPAMTLPAPAPVHEPDSLDRAAFARRIQTAYLDAGVDAKVRVVGKGGRLLRIDYYFASRVFSHEMEKAESFWRKADSLQISRIELIGYDYANAWQPGRGPWGWASGHPEDQ